MYVMKKILIIVSVVLFIDFFTMQIFGNKINDLMYGKYNTSNKLAYKNRIKNHHDLRKNQELDREWYEVYKHKTDEFGNRIGDCENNNKNNKNIFIVGDSMVEGIGINYKETFTGLLNCHFKNLNIKNIGVASYSPIIYYEKIKKNLNKFDKTHTVIVFLGVNDIQDEANYIKIKNRIVDSSEKNYFPKNLVFGYLFNDFKFFLKNNFLSFKLIDLIKDTYEKKNRKNVVEKRANPLLGIDHPKTIWTFDNESYLKFGKKGLAKSKDSLKKIYNLSLENNFDFYLAIWPAPDQIYYNEENSLHRKYWIEWTKENNVELIDFNNYFFQDDKVETIKKYFIPGDTHWNKNGHLLIYKHLLKVIKKNNF